MNMDGDTPQPLWWRKRRLKAAVAVVVLLIPLSLPYVVGELVYASGRGLLSKGLQSTLRPLHQPWPATGISLLTRFKAYLDLRHSQGMTSAKLLSLIDEVEAKREGVAGARGVASSLHPAAMGSVHEAMRVHELKEIDATLKVLEREFGRLEPWWLQVF